MTKLLIKNGTIATVRGIEKKDILIENAQFVKIEQNISSSEADTCIDASGKLIFPGGIDQHTHIESPLSGTLTAPWKTESIAAAIGGNTLLIDFALQPIGGSLMDGVERTMTKARMFSAVDYSFHIAVCDFNDNTLSEMETLSKQGINGFKLFLAYKDSPLMVNDETLFKVCQKAKELDSLVLVHAENGDIIHALQQMYIQQGKTSPQYHSLSRPAALEEEATKRAIIISELTGARMLIVHVSCEGAVKEIMNAHSRGVNVLGETCPQYLVLDDSYYQLDGFESAKFVCAPPLRTQHDQQVLWQALTSNVITSIGSDHVGFNFKGQKEMGISDFTKIPNGIPGVEHRIPLLYSYGVTKRRLTIQQFVALTSTNPAIINGLYPRKGDIIVGTDADLIIFNPDTEWTISKSNQNQASDYTPYEGMQVQGSIETVILRGNTIVQKGEFIGQNGEGQFVPRDSFISSSVDRYTSVT